MGFYDPYPDYAHPLRYTPTGCGSGGASSLYLCVGLAVAFVLLTMAPRPSPSSCLYAPMRMGEQLTALVTGMAVTDEVVVEADGDKVPMETIDAPSAAAKPDASDTMSAKEKEKNHAKLRDVCQGRPVVVLFFAHWCPHCAAMKKRVAAVKKAFPDVRFVLVNAEAVPAEATQGQGAVHEVKYYPSVVSYANGEKVAADVSPEEAAEAAAAHCDEAASSKVAAVVPAAVEAVPEAALEGDFMGSLFQ
jgi:thiol-disulfide isomerase/thioredoxin